MENLLLHKYRSDRRKLLDFILSVGLIREIQTPQGAISLRDIDLDAVSVDSILECANHGGILDLSEATKKYYYEHDYPTMINSQSGSSYFLLSEPLSGSPPQRMPPQVPDKPITNLSSHSSSKVDPLIAEEIASFGHADAVRHMAETAKSCQPMSDANILSLGLPTLGTGLSDDDVRETAYEVLLASVAFSGVQIHSFEDKKKEKKSKFLTRRRSKKDNSQSLSDASHSDLLDTIRIQMELSEAMDACIRKGLIKFAFRTVTGQLDVPQISLELLSCVCKSDFPSERSYMHWLKRQANILEELLYFSANLTTDGQIMFRGFLSKLRNTEEWSLRMAPSERAVLLTSIRRVALKLSKMPTKFGIPCETYYWVSGYHLNVKLYEKLLCSVFDIVEEGQLIEEAEEILSILKLTWPILGITQKMHITLYAWVLFQQFLGTGEAMLLEHSIAEMQKVVLSEDGDGNEGSYLNSLICSVGVNGNETKLSLIHAVFLSMRIWCDSQLRDYHLHFSKKPENFGRVLTLAIVVGIHTANDGGEVQFNKPIAGTEMASKCFREYVERSIQAEYKRVLNTLEIKSKAEKRHPLAVLADELQLIAERESTMFCPKLCHWCPESRMLPAILLHQLYGERLKPFLDGVSLLSEDVRLVLPAADMLDQNLTQIFRSACGEDMNPLFSKDLKPYQVGEVSAPIILHWVSVQHDNILEWTERAFDLEDWEPLSSQQRQAASIIEVFRIIEETIDQFFNLNLPMDITHLKSLLSGIVRSLQAYLLKLTSQLVDKNYLFPAAPALTRYKEAMTPFIKKKSIEYVFLEERVQNQLNELTTSKLCVKLNTLHYIQNQIRTLEDAIRKQWMLVRPLREYQPLGASKEGSPTFSGSVDEPFATFNSIREAADKATTKICDFIGTKVLFWDLRDSFLFSLYRGDVESARLESNLSQLDTEGYIWILLDGGPSRVFSDTDNAMMLEDLNILKDFFVANGEGLPRAVVEREAKLAQQILNLYTLQTETAIGMLMSASEQISKGLDCRKPGGRSPEDADTLLRVLCHKKDREASKFLKKQYQLPKSSDYEDFLGKESTLKSPLISDLLKRSASFHWSETSMKGLKSMKKKFQVATSEIKYTTSR
ncbi:protein unc-13 homolog isoform X2 [Magnolia sinica]|uniref:protein unc-13 homolog isoform X2 n=1 Tax=Magnolia sinica TaxID=86752 RepID=UPI0026593187|nr:protein unc-13 homolog isoform X2 [Magnolia sinica]